MAAPRRTVEKARSLRRSMTLAEVRLWQVLRGRPHGVKFRRQHPIGPYILDFYCPSARLTIEVDGISHDFAARAARDADRHAWLLEQGLKVLRIADTEVSANLEGVVRHILEHCRGLKS